MGFLGARTVGATRESFPLFRCPSCRKSGVMDGDQFHGRTSIICRCGWHKTVNWDRLDTGERVSWEYAEYKEMLHADAGS